MARLVTPPAIAASISDSSVARYSKPGSRSRAARSMSPGQTTRPVASMTRSASKPSGAWPWATMRPLAMNRSVTVSSWFAGSITRPLAIWIFIGVSRPCSLSAQHAHHCHAHRNAEGDLRQDHRLGAVGDRGIDLHAAVHRPGVHDDGVGFGQRELLGREPPDLEELLWGGQQRAVHAFVLQAQH